MKPMKTIDKTEEKMDFLIKNQKCESKVKED